MLRSCGEGSKSPRLAAMESQLVRVRALVRLRLNPNSPGELMREYEYGSGVVIGDGRVLTAYHTVRGWADVPASDREIAVMPATAKTYSPVALDATDQAKDVAVLKANPWTLRASSPSCTSRDADDVQPGAIVWAAGFPAAADSSFFELGLIRGVVLERDARITQLRGEQRRAFRWIAVSQEVPPGFSGGALFDEHGALLGMILGAPMVSGRWQEFSYGIRLSELAHIGG